MTIKPTIDSNIKEENEMKVLKLSVDYDGYYGGDVHEYCLLPVEWNGLYREKLDLGEHEQEIYLGEIEGKHSEVYGDLTVEEIEIDELSPKELSDLINNADNSEFEITFEGWEDDFQNEFEDDDEYEDILLKQKSFEDTMRITFNSKHEIKTMRISDELIKSLKDSSVTLKTITIDENDYDDVLSILNERGIKVY